MNISKEMSKANLLVALTKLHSVMSEDGSGITGGLQSFLKDNNVSNHPRVAQHLFDKGYCKIIKFEDDSRKTVTYWAHNLKPTIELVDEILDDMKKGEVSDSKSRGRDFQIGSVLRTVSADIAATERDIVALGKELQDLESQIAIINTQIELRVHILEKKRYVQEYLENA
jgi:hypothetical protein